MIHAMMFLLLTLGIQVAHAEETVHGIVTENYMEDADTGAYLSIIENQTGKRIFVVYTPTDDEDECVSKIEGFWVAKGDQVVIRGDILRESQGKELKEYTLTTCSEESYIHAKRFEKAVGRE